MKQVIFTNDQVAKHRCLADSIKTNLQTEAAVISEKEKHLSYNTNLPEKFTPEMVNELSEYNGNFAKAVRVAVGETAAELFNANKELDKVVAKVGYFAKGDDIEMTVSRTSERPNNFAAEGEPKTTIRHLSFTTEKFNYRGTSAKALKTAMGEEFHGKYCK